MHAANAAGDEHANTGQISANHGRGDGGRTEFFLAQHIRQIAATDFEYALGMAQLFELRIRQANANFAVDDGDGRWHRAAITDDLLDFACSLHVLRVGHTMRNDGGFERHDRFACGTRGEHFVGVDQKLFHV